MITSNTIFKLVETFERVLPHAQHEGAVSMHQCVVSDHTDGHQCGTIHCHAGWYALAHSWDLKSHYLDDGSETVTYSKGMGNMRRDLGLGSRGSLEEWAQSNPEIWGNEYGDYMFASRRAFNYEGKLTLQKIVDHWGEVGMRLLLEELYQKEKLKQGVIA